MSELKTYFDDDSDEVKNCPFCGREYTGTDYEEYMEWWLPSACDHMCCAECGVYSEEYGAAICPQCAKEEKERNGKAT